MKSSTRTFALEVAKPVMGGAAPVLVIYVVEGSGMLALPKEVYRSKDKAAIAVGGEGMRIHPEAAWLPANYREVVGYDELEVAIMRILDPTSPALQAEADRVVSSIITDVRQKAGDLPGFYS